MLTYPTINPVFLKLGPLEFRWYGLAYVLGLILPFTIPAFKREFAEKLKMSADDRSNLMLYLMLGIILGGRLGYVIFYDLAHYISEPLSIIMLNKGGMSYHGGAIGAMLAMLFYGHQHSKSKLILLDLLGIFSTIGIGLGRLANFINAELYGRVTTVDWGMIFPGAGPLPRHPSQLYEAFFEGLVLFGVLYFLKRKNILKDGQLFAIYVFLYGVFRFFIEFTREPDAHLGFVWGVFSMGQVLCFLWGLIGIYLFYYLKQKK